jgi:hypothetical protein
MEANNISDDEGLRVLYVPLAIENKTLRQSHTTTQIKYPDKS